MRNPAPANWDKWALMPHCELWQAICLSMDFEPPQRCNLVEFLRLEHNTFKDRLEVCKVNLGDKLPALDTHTCHSDGIAARVKLATFAAVASKWGWPIPQQLQDKATLPDEARALKPEPQPAPAPTTTAITAPVVEAVRHTTKDERRHTLKPEIEHAQSLCKDASDVVEVWAALQKMAEKKHGQLLGATEDGLQYLKNGEAVPFTRNALQKRLKRSWAKTQKDRR